MSEISFGIKKLNKYISSFLGEEETESILSEHINFLSESSGTPNLDSLTEIEYKGVQFADNINSIFSRTCKRVRAQEIERQKNIESIIDKTKEKLEDKNDVSEVDVNKDWLTRFFGFAKDISDESMQDFWSKILAGEIQSPNSFSFRSLDLMTKLSQEEARLFEKYCKYVVNFSQKLAIIRDEEFERTQKIIYEDIMTLAECGLLDSNPLLSLSSQNQSSKSVIHVLYAKEYLKVEIPEKLKIEFPVYQLTRFGTELLKLVQVDYDAIYFRAVAQFLARRHRKVTFTLYKNYAIQRNSIFPTEGEIIS